MSNLGEQVLIALADQGWGMTITDEEVALLTPDRRRKHWLPVGIFSRNDRLNMTTLKLVVEGLRITEGFIPPAGFERLPLAGPEDL